MFSPCWWCSVSTLLGYLKRFDANADIYLGERYGYQLLSPNGFNYITGGGGIVFSLSVIEKLAHICRCPSPHSPDDMIIALCLQRIGIEPIHSSRFHQVRFGLHFIKNVPLTFDDNAFACFLLFHFYFFLEWCRHDQLTTPRKFYCIIIRFHFINFGKSIHIMYTNIGWEKMTPLRLLKGGNIAWDWTMDTTAVKIKTNYVIGTAMTGIIESMIPWKIQFIIDISVGIEEYLISVCVWMILNMINTYIQCQIGKIKWKRLSKK